MTFTQSNTDFIKDMLLGVWFNDDDALQIIIEQTLEIFDDWLQSEILSALSDSQMESFDNFVSQDPNDEEIYNFFNKSIKDFDNFVDWLYDKFKTMYVSEYKKSLGK